jgi:predicted secreted Zn-dependent protease
MMAGLRAFPASSLGDEMPTWKSPWETVIAWLVTHDSFHGAQVRSMGLPTFRTKRHD